MSEEEHNREMMIEAMRDQRGEPLPENPPPGSKWKAKEALNRLNLNGAEHDVLGCLVERANRVTGLCYPSEEYIAGWIDRPRRTVERAIASLRKKHLIKVIYRGTTSSRYYISWRRLFAAFRLIKTFEKKRHAEPLPKVADHPAKSGGSCASKVADKPTESEPTEFEPTTLSGAFAKANGTIVENHQEEKRKRAARKEDVESAESNNPTSRSFWQERADRAAAELKDCNNPERRVQLEATIERARSYLG